MDGHCGGRRSGGSIRIPNGVLENSDINSEFSSYLPAFDKGRRIGFEVKFNEAPDVTRSMHEVVRLLSLDHLFVVCPTRDTYPVDARITVLPARDVPRLAERIDAV